VEKIMSTLTVGARRAVSRCLQPLARRAARAYIAGETLADALVLRDRLAGRGMSATLGYWDCESQPAREVADVYLTALRALTGSADYLSIKLPALRFSSQLVAEIAGVAKGCGVRLHCDSHDIETSERMQTLTDEILAIGAEVSFTLPGRWQRSLADADWACQRQLPVRVVKGQWADPADPAREMCTGYLEVIDRLAGQARHVAVASHDAPLASEAIRRLQAAGTPCCLELLYGLPLRASLEAAASLGAAVRVYVPYGAAYLPYALGKLRHNPRMAWWLLRDLLGAG
jgi:proline dehydrogenase